VDRRAVDAFEVGERPVVGLADQGCAVLDVFYFVKCQHVEL
jgi:hypothetical protein